MKFVPLNRDSLLRALDGTEDILSKRAAEEHAFFSKLSCVECGNDCRAQQHLRVSEDGVVAQKKLAECLGCGCVFDPDLKIIVKPGNLDRLRPDIPILTPE